MSARHALAFRTPRTRWLRGWRGLLLAGAALLGAGAIAQGIAQVVASSTAPTYCYNRASGCHSSLDQAETVMRADSFFQGAGDAVEHIGTAQINATTLWMQYAINDRPAESIGYAAFWGDYGIHGNSQGKCTPSEDQTVLPGWCHSEQQVIDEGVSSIRTGFPSCLLNKTTKTGDYSLPLLRPVVGTRYGRVEYGQSRYEVELLCPDLSIVTKSFHVLKQRPLYCRSGFRTLGTQVLDDYLAQDMLCEPLQDDVVRIATPVRQCGSCAGSDNPVYPATGEKRRAEADFEFAGTAFTRHYRSLRQFRNNPRFAVAWSHTWSDRILTGPSSATPYLHIDESGDYEGYAPLGGNRYRGENSTGNVLERVNANGIGWRLRSDDGEVREFDTAGLLIAVRHPDAPLEDVTLTHLGNSVATVTDAQGRRLQFEYAANLLRRILLPDGRTVDYGYDGRGNLISATYPDGAVRRYHYNEPGLAGAEDQHHQLTGITAEDGRRFASFGYDARGRATSSRVLGTPEELTTVSYPDEDRATVRTADNGEDAYTVEPGTYRRILSRGDGSGTARVEYTPEGQPSRTIDKRGIATEYTYLDGRLATMTEAAGTPEQRRHEIDRDPATGLPIERRIRDAAGTLKARVVHSYNARRQTTAVSTIDPTTGTARTTAYAYCDALGDGCPMIGLLRSIDGPLPGSADSTRFEYRMTDAPGCDTAPTACAWRKGDPWKTVNALGHTVEILAADGAGRALSMRDGNGIVSELVRDPRGRPLTIRVRGADDAADHDDQLTRIEYLPTGDVQRMILPDGVQTLFEYDAAQRLSRIVDGAGNALAFRLNAAGEVIGEDTRDASGTLLRTLSRTYDTLGRLQAVRDADLRATTFDYDPGDHLILETDALGRRTRHEYDALGRLRSSLQDVDGIAARTQLRYDALDRVERVTDPNGLHTDTVYNGFGEAVTLISPDTGTTTSTYDAAGRLSTRTDARGITATYTYDALDRVTAIAYPDASRNVALVHDIAPGECPAEERFHIGRLARMTDASGQTLYCYDRFGHLTRKLQTTQGRTFAVRYDHTPRAGDGNGVLLRPRPAAGHLMALTYPDGAQVRIGRNQLREPVSLTVVLANGQVHTLLDQAAYYPFGPVSQWRYGNGRLLKRSLNRDYLPGFVEDTRPGGLSEGYWFDAVGNLESLRRADQLDPPRRRFGYDRLDRLTEVRDGATNALLHSYASDATGNRTQHGSGGASTAYGYVAGSHRLASVGGVPRQYDAAGNTVRIGGTSTTASVTPASATPVQAAPARPSAQSRARGWRAELQARARDRRAPASDRRIAAAPAVASAAAIREFRYDDAGRLRQVLRDGAVAMDYLHNGKGERVHRSGSGRTVSTVFDEAGRWLGDYDANGQPIQQAIWHDDLPVGLLVGAGAAQKLYYLQPDALGTPRVVIDPDRDVAVWRWDLAGDPYGAQPPAEDPDGDGTAFVLDLRFPGQRHDPISGLYENYFRDYDPTTGRYLQSDPIGLGDGPSTYAYAGGAPLGFSDPLGLRKTALGNMLGKMIATPILQRAGGGLLARTASATAKARAQAQRAADMARRLGRIFGRMGKGRGKSEPPGCGNTPHYVKVNNSDPAADALAERLGGISSVRFPGKFKDREFDVFSSEFIGQTKPANFDIGSAFRNQAKATFEASIELNRKPYFHFDGPPSPRVIDKIREYSSRYGIEATIDTTPF